VVGELDGQTCPLSQGLQALQKLAPARVWSGVSSRFGVIVLAVTVA
jgi:hypothetical protein